MRYEKRIEGLFFNKLFENMLRYLEIRQLGQNFHAKVGGCAAAPLIARQFEPIVSSNFADQVVITRSSPGPLQVDRPDQIPIGITMLNMEGRAPASPHGIRRRRNSALPPARVDSKYFLRHMTDESFDQIGHFFKIGISPVNLQHGKLWIVPSGNSFISKIAVQLEDLIESPHQ